MDYMIRGTACHDQFRFFAVQSTQVVQTAMDLHQLTPAPALLLGRLLTGILLMGYDLKDADASLSINIDAVGPLRGAIAVYDPIGKVRGYAKQPAYIHPDIKTNLRIGELLGEGTLTVIKDLKLKAPVHGTISLVSGEVAEDIAAYYDLSEQTPAAVSLGVLFDQSGRVRTAGGYLIQQLPQASASAVEQLKHNLSRTPYITDLLDMNKSLEDILSSSIFKDMDVQVNDIITPQYKCNCSKERFAQALRLLGKEELLTMQEGIDPVCHYCNTTYHFSAEEIANLIQSLDGDA